MSTVLTEGRHAGEHLISEAEHDRAREVLTVAADEVLTAGHICARQTQDDTVEVTAGGGNAGNGGIAAVVLGPKAQLGDYIVTLLGAGTFKVSTPNGNRLKDGVVDAEYAGDHITFTAAAGGTAFEAADVFTITVAAGTGQVKALSLTADDGTEKPAAISLGACDATGAARGAVFHVRDCQVKGASLTYPDDATPDQIAAINAALADLGIIVR